MKRIIGFSGGICSGKTESTKYLKSKGIKIVDCDKLGHKTYEFGTNCYKKLIETFGPQIINNDDSDEKKGINRKVLGKIVFSDEKEMKKLKSIVWPEISQLIKQEIDNCHNYDIIVFEAAVLIEAGWYKLMNEIWILSCSEEVCLKRLMNRNKITKNEAENIMKSQISNEERVKYANFVINSDLPVDDVKKEIDKALKFKN